MNTPVDIASSEELQRIFDLQAENQWQVRRSSARQRITKLEKLKACLQAHEQEVKDALYADLRKAGQSAESELVTSYTDLDDAIDNLHHGLLTLRRHSRCTTPVRLLDDDSETIESRQVFRLDGQRLLQQFLGVFRANVTIAHRIDGSSKKQLVGSWIDTLVRRYRAEYLQV